MSDDDRGRRIEKARAAYDQAADAYESARKALFDEILTGLEEGMGPSAVGRHSGFTREYVARIRDGKVKASKTPER
ncbi:hypothetical protein ACWEPH_26910 [Nocardia beijingensis]